jgi:uncharacterized protein YggU (UPF0235/DUF167 family)
VYWQVLRVGKTSLSIVSGHTGRDKFVAVSGMTAERVQEMCLLAVTS